MSTATVCHPSFNAVVADATVAPPNSVSRGPLAVHVRRWGFPVCGVPQLYPSPARMHIDVAYTFFASHSYLVKASRTIIADA